MYITELLQKKNYVEGRRKTSFLRKVKRKLNLKSQLL